MNTSSILSKLKEMKVSQILMTYPLLISVLAASVVLCIVFAVQKHAPKTEPADIIPAVTTTIPTQTTTVPMNAGMRPGTDSSGQTPASGQNAAATTTTETVPAAPQFEPVEDTYFHDALFIGNSRTVGLSMFGSMPEETTFYATVGMNIYDLMDSTAQIPPEEGPEMSFSSLMNGQRFGKIYIMLGINDLGTGTSESFAEYYKSVLDQIHQMQPEATIYIQSIINVDAARDAQGDSINNANINEKNALLAGLANDDYIFYLNVNEVLVDENGALNADYTSDGIHLGGGSLSIWEDYLRSHAIVKE